VKIEITIEFGESAIDTLTYQNVVEMLNFYELDCVIQETVIEKKQSIKLQTKCDIAFLEKIFFPKIDLFLNNFRSHEQDQIKSEISFIHLIETAKTKPKKMKFDEFRIYVWGIHKLIFPDSL